MNRKGSLGRYVAPLVVMVSICASTNAQSSSAFKFRGYYSATAVYTDKDNPFYQFVFFGDQDEPVEGQKLDWRSDSKFGVQLDYRPSETISGHLQLLARNGSSEDPLARVRLAYIDYKPNPDWSVKLGRTVMGLAMMEEAMFADYGNLWVRPPLSIYAIFPKSESDGIQVSRFDTWGQWYVRTQLSYGQADYYSQLFRRKMRDDIGLSMSASSHSWSWKIAFRKGELNTYSERLNAALELIQSAALQQQREDVAKDYSNALDFILAQGGFRYFDGRLTVQGEALLAQSDQLHFPLYSYNFYLHSGYQFTDKATPYFILSHNGDQNRSGGATAIDNNSKWDVGNTNN